MSVMTIGMAGAKPSRPNWEVGVYQGASTGDDPSSRSSKPVEGAGQALEHLLAALKILDQSDVSPAIGARLDQTIDMLREELARRS